MYALPVITKYPISFMDYRNLRFLALMSLLIIGISLEILLENKKNYRNFSFGNFNSQRGFGDILLAGLLNACYPSVVRQNLSVWDTLVLHHYLQSIPKLKYINGTKRCFLFKKLFADIEKNVKYQNLFFGNIDKHFTAIY